MSHYCSHKFISMSACGLTTLLLALAGQASATAQEISETAYKTVQECRGIENSSTRVACYDTVVDGSIFTIEERRRAERKSIGQSQLKNEDGTIRGEPEKVIVEIVDVKKLPTGKLQFTTADGQIWRQNSSGHMAPEKTPFQAEIRQGRLGSYSIVSLRWPKLIKVTRIK